jgi:DNA-binding NarL/FixJ family response regulator
VDRYDEAELEGHLWRIAAELEASGILMHAGATPGLSLARIPEAAGLTPRQWEILRRIVAGQRVRAIASELYVSPSTVRNHLSAIFQRFGVHSQAELLARLTPTDTPSI